MAFLVADKIQNAVLKTENAALRAQLSTIKEEEEAPDVER